MNKSSKIGVGVIGTGRIGKLHIEHLARNIPEAELIAICSLDAVGIESLTKQFNIPKTTKDYAALLADPRIDAVLVASSTDTHVEISQAAAKAGKHVFCEKPISLDLEQIDETLAIVEEAGIKFQVGFNRRFDASFERIREAVASGEIGEPHIMRITSRDPAPPPIEYVKVSGGIFLDMTIHDFDMARYLIGDEVVEVYATGGVRVDPKIGEAGDIDTTVITLRFRNGVIATIDNSRGAVYGYDQRVEVSVQKGWLQRRIHRRMPLLLAGVRGHALQRLCISLWNAIRQRFSRSYRRSFRAFRKTRHRRLQARMVRCQL